jgi:uroporphyrin-III C-methyltransferase/precorrin-2 dehydrogenase/sirohydrochlorin ferrochelatase
MNEERKIGKVYFVAAGPGDPELLTIKAARVLKEADVVLHDRLVSADTLLLANANAEVILTGKQKDCNSMKQSEINELILRYALESKTVVRLKGGDVSFFSNILDELETVTNNQIPFEIIPGVTAASGCAVYAGIPLTARGYADSVRFLTLHQSELLQDKEWEALANTKDTLVFYMTVTHLETLVEKLLSFGADSKLSLSIISQGTTPMQQNFYSTLGSAKEDFAEKVVPSPSILIIGKVVALAQKFHWFEGGAAGVYFKELPKKNFLNHAE